jgi:hypothetical protein
MPLPGKEIEKGSFKPEYFDPYCLTGRRTRPLAAQEHFPFHLKSITRSLGLSGEIAAGVYRTVEFLVRSRWFCVLKKDRKSLRIVHDLQPLNAISIQDRGVPPLTEPYAESFGSRACYGALDLFVSFDQRVLDLVHGDMTISRPHWAPSDSHEYLWGIQTPCRSCKAT